MADAILSPPTDENEPPPVSTCLAAPSSLNRGLRPPPPAAAELRRPHPPSYGSGTRHRPAGRGSADWTGVEQQAHDLDVGIGPVPRAAGVARAVDRPPERRAVVGRVEHVERRAGVQQQPGVLRLAEPGSLMQGSPRVEPRRREVRAGGDEQGNRGGAGAPGDVGEQAVFLGIAGARAPGMRLQQAPRLVETPADDGDGQPVGGREGGVGPALRQQAHQLGEPAARRVGVRGLPSRGARIDVGAVVQQTPHRGGAPAPRRHVERGLGRRPGARRQVRSRFQPARELRVAVRTVVVVQQRVQARLGLRPAGAMPICANTARLSHSAHASTRRPASSR